MVVVRLLKLHRLQSLYDQLLIDLFSCIELIHCGGSHETDSLTLAILAKYHFLESLCNPFILDLYMVRHSVRFVVKVDRHAIPGAFRTSAVHRDLHFEDFVLLDNNAQNHLEEAGKPCSLSSAFHLVTHDVRKENLQHVVHDFKIAEGILTLLVPHVLDEWHSICQGISIENRC